MTKHYEHKTDGHFISSVTIEKRGLNISDYIELVRCKDGILRRIDTVAESDRFVWSDNTMDGEAD